MSYDHIVRPALVREHRLPILFWDQIVRGWWTGVSKQCATAHCFGVLVAEPPEDRPGRIACLACGRETHAIVNRGLSREVVRGLAGRRIAWDERKQQRGTGS